MIELLHYKRQSRVVKKINEIAIELNKFEKWGKLVTEWYKMCDEAKSQEIMKESMGKNFSLDGKAGESRPKKPSEDGLLGVLLKGTEYKGKDKDGNEYILISGKPEDLAQAVREWIREKIQPMFKSDSSRKDNFVYNKALLDLAQALGIEEKE